MIFRKITGICAFAVAAGLIALFPSCSSYVPNNTEVRIHSLSDPDMLNPINYQSADAGYITNILFPALLNIDFADSNKVIPVLAESRPKLEKTNDGHLKISFVIRKEAVWDNGTPVTARDVEFTLKVIKNPKVKNEQNKPYYEFIEDIQIDPSDPKKFTLLCNEVYMLAETSAGDYGLLPEYVYDPKGLMRSFTLPQLNKEKDKLSSDPKINEFANDFNSEKRMREKDYISGCGAYKMVEWTTGQRIVLEKKKDWWGDALKGVNCYFEAYPKKLIYQTINDQTTAIVSLKAGNLDVMYSIKPKDFVDLKASDKIKSTFNLHTPPFLSYYYFGINTKNKKFEDKKTRQALAHLVDIPKMIHTLMYDLATQVTGFIHPSNTRDYEKSIQPYDFDIEKAKALLTEAGWKDSNGDGTLDKMIDGVLTDFTIKFSVNAGNDVRKQAALMFQEEARKVGIKVDVIQQDWSVYLQNQKNHDFEMYFGGWVASPTPNDPKQIYHTESYNGGSNYVGFGNPESDAVIDSLRKELDENKRSAYYKKLQLILHDECSYIYLWAPTERMAINKKFTNAEPSVMRPGFWPCAFQTAK
ncbi:MAG TPA: ABC transporter substrate-binding protein [Bacteroidia bacterium]|jgi:peptide/nickel transport system substrate-binding protein